MKIAVWPTPYPLTTIQYAGEDTSLMKFYFTEWDNAPVAIFPSDDYDDSSHFPAIASSYNRAYIDDNGEF